MIVSKFTAATLGLHCAVWGPAGGVEGDAATPAVRRDYPVDGSPTTMGGVGGGHRQLNGPRPAESILGDLRSDNSVDSGDLTPNGEGSFARDVAAIRGDGFRIWNMKEIRNLIMDRKELLRLPG
jgi:hypothetical protein